VAAEFFKAEIFHGGLQFVFHKLVSRKGREAGEGKTFFNLRVVRATFLQ
jgi:hypothetical protein